MLNALFNSTQQLNSNAKHSNSVPMGKGPIWIKIDINVIKFVTELIYLGVFQRLAGKSFSKHNDRRVHAATFSIQTKSIFKNISRDGFKIFDFAIYGIEAVWLVLSTAELHTIETAKPRFLKKNHTASLN